MDEDGFRMWLIETGSVRKTQVQDTKHLEESQGDLDNHYERDRLDSIIRLFNYDASHLRQRKSNPTTMKFNIRALSDSDEWYRRLKKNLDNYKSIARLYQRFRDATKPDQPLLKADQAIEDGDLPVSYEDARQRAERAIVVRRGQLRFRNALRKAYHDTCAITGCTVPDVLEAAHIGGYLGEHTDRVKNGLLLRADIHTLFDCGLITLDPDTLTVLVKPGLQRSEYGAYHGKGLAVALPRAAKPDRDALMQRNKDVYDRR